MFKMNEFRIFAHGDDFDVDRYLSTATLKPDYVWRRGDQRRYACVKSEHETSGVEFTLGDGWKVPLQDQEDIALAYLQAHREELRALAKFPGVDTFIVGLQYVCKLDGGILGFVVGPSSQLMWHALNAGVRPNYYVSFDRTKLDQEMEEMLTKAVNLTRRERPTKRSRQKAT